MTYEEMVSELEFLSKEEPYKLPSLNELFSLGYSNIIIDGTYKNKYYGKDNGANLLLILNEKANLISHNIEKVMRGSERSDYSFSTDNSTYIFEYNGLYLTIKTFTPRSQKSMGSYLSRQTTTKS